MKKLAIIFATLLNFSVMATSTDVPASVKAQFETKYPHAQNVCWEKQDRGYVADFYLNKHEAKACFNNDGALNEVDVLVNWKQLPANLKMYVYKHYHTFALQECDVVEHKGHMDGYAVSLISQGHTYNLRFTSEGTIIN